MNGLICFALKEEAAAFRPHASARPGLNTLIVGIGRANASRSVQAFLRGTHPDWVYTCGFAGGLAPDLQVGDLVHDTATTAPETARKLVALGVKPARFHCADRIAITVAEKKALRERTGAEVVEMESAAIHAACQAAGIPCTTLRVISDTAGEDLPLDFNALSKPDKSLDFGRLAWAVARSPGRIPHLLRLPQNSARAAAGSL